MPNRKQPGDRSYSQVQDESQGQCQLQSRRIDRHRVWQRLEIAALVAAFLTACGSEATPDLGGDVTDQNAMEPTQAVFYETTAQCQADLKQQQQTYDLLLQDYQMGRADAPPNPLPMGPGSCEAQMQAAHQEHEKTAPIYGSLADCQAEGVACETVRQAEDIPPGTVTSLSTSATSASSSIGYRPAFAGAYIYPEVYDAGPDFVYVSPGGFAHSVYEPRVVYQTVQPGQVMTAQGRVIPASRPGRVLVSRFTMMTPPARPAGIAAKGTIAGRSSQGFGSTYKSTGSGGK